jgi:hypothetical protein
MSPRPARQRDDADQGAVAIIAALAVTLLLVPVAALAADLGAVYVREGDLQQVADVAARAGADELALQQRDDPAPAAVMDAARTAAVQALCAGVDTSGDGPWASACAQPSWAADGDTANGEVSFYTGPPDADGRFPATQAVTDPPPQDWITGIRVVTPPLRVELGLAAAFSTGHTDVQQASTAGIFTVLPRHGFFPMYLTSGEYGGFCTRGAPRHSWGAQGPLCYTTTATGTVARGFLFAHRSHASEDSDAVTWNTADGFDREHLPLPGGTVTLADQDFYAGPDYWAYVSRLREGLFDGPLGVEQPGRLTGIDCPGGNDPVSWPRPGVQSAHLKDFIDLRLGDEGAFRDHVWSQSATPLTKRGWLDSAVLQCGRLAVVPVLMASSNGSSAPDTIQHPPPFDGLGQGTTNLTWRVHDLRLVWLDDELWDGDDRPVATGQCFSRGFYWQKQEYPYDCGSTMRVYTGYILDPRLLPAIVSGKDAVNALDRFVGSGMPATVRLLRDVSDPRAS